MRLGLFNHGIAGFLLVLLLPSAITQTLASSGETASGPPQTSQALPMEKEDIYEAMIASAVRSFEAKDYEKAMEQLNEVIAVYPQDAFALNLQGAVYTKMRKFEEARAVFQKALETDSRFFPARFNLGEILFLEGRNEEALVYFQTLSDSFWRNELLEFKLVLLYSATNKLEDARRILGRMRFPGDTPAWYYANAAFAKAEDDGSSAKKYLRTAQELFTEDKRALYEESLQEAKLMP